MRIHHFTAATLCPVARRFVNGDGGLFARGHMVCHCLLIETPAHGLVLVDSGLGTDDVADPTGRLGYAFHHGIAPTLTRADTALAHVEALGFRREDVRHVVLTHLDLDHAGGLPDFPKAKVHVMADEHDAATARRTFLERERYRPAHFAHRPDFALHRADGEAWRGLPIVRGLPGLPPEILLVPMSGHTRGHACVAIELPGRTLVHAGDAYFHRSVVEGGDMPFGLYAFEQALAMDRSRLADNHARLRELAAVDAITVFSAHDPVELDRMRPIS